MKTSFPIEYDCDLFFVFKYGSEFMDQLITSYEVFSGFLFLTITEAVFFWEEVVSFLPFIEERFSWYQ